MRVLLSLLFTTFLCTCVSAPLNAQCDGPDSQNIINLDDDGAAVQWGGGETSATSQQFVVSFFELDDPTTGSVITLSDINPSISFNGLASGTMYYVYVRNVCESGPPTNETIYGPWSTFSFTTTGEAVPPVNDSLVNVYVLEMENSYASHGVDGPAIAVATEESGELTCQHSRSWWYAFTPEETAFYSIQSSIPRAIASNANTDVAVGLYTGTDHPLTELGCFDNDNETGDGAGERIVIELTAGTTYYFRVSVPDDGIPESVLTRILFLENELNTWEGNVSTDWFTAANWSLNTTPFPTSSILINSEAGFDCVIAGADAEAGDIAVDGGQLTVDVNASLTINTSSDGIVVSDNGVLEISGNVLMDNVPEIGLYVEEGEAHIRSTGLLEIDDCGEEAILLHDTMSIAGELNIVGTSDHALTFESASGLDILENATVVIDSTTGKGILIELGNLHVSGTVSIYRASNDAIDLAAGEMSVANTGVINIYDANRGIDKATFTNHGTITVSTTASDGINTLGDCTNTGTISIDNASSDGLDLEVGTSFANQGILKISNSGSDAIEDGTLVNDGALFAEGTISSTTDFASESELNPGQSPGCLEFTATEVDLREVIINVEIDGTDACNSYDQIQFLGDLLRLSGATLALSGSYIPQIGDEFLLFDLPGAGIPIGSFSNFGKGGGTTFNGAAVDVDYNGGDGNDIVLFVTAILPLDLLSFTGAAETKQNVLHWSTANEDAFSHFELERSSGGAGQWSKLKEMQGAAAGAVEVENNYAFIDDAPLASAYYRLRMVDLDGRYSYSPIVYLENTEAGQLLAYPNPNTGQFTLQLPTELPAEITLYDLHGRVVYKSLESPATQNLELQLKPGIYLLSAQTEQQQWTKRILVR